MERVVQAGVSIPPCKGPDVFHPPSARRSCPGPWDAEVSRVTPTWSSWAGILVEQKENEQERLS